MVLEPTQVENNRAALGPGGALIAPEGIDARKLRSAKSLNVALLGMLSTRLEIPEEAWLAAIRANLPEKVLDLNLEAFAEGRKA